MKDMIKPSTPNRQAEIQGINFQNTKYPAVWQSLGTFIQEREVVKIYVQQEDIAFCEFSILKVYMYTFRISLEKVGKWKKPPTMMNPADDKLF